MVDDEVDIESLFLQKFRKEIRDKKMSILFRQNGKEALQALKEHPDVELVLSDINMPEMDGLTLLEKIKNKNSTPKAIIISAYGDMKNIRTAMNRGAFDFITKPINFDDVSVTIDKAIQHIEMLQKANKNQQQLLSIHKELEVAKVIQESILPASRVFCSEYDFIAEVQPANEVGGDFYDFFSINKEYVGLVIADVSGKGISAAIFAVVTQTLLKATQSSLLCPKEHIDYINQICVKNNKNHMFVTLFYGVLNLKTGLLKYVNAGHNSPYKIDKNGKIKALSEADNVAVGVKKKVQFTENQVQLQSDDFLFLYTDGIPEARDNNKEFFGTKRLVDTLSQASNQSTKEMANKIVQSVEDFTKGVQQFDDITYALFKYKV